MHGVVLLFCGRPSPRRRSIHVSDDRLAAFVPVTRSTQSKQRPREVETLGRQGGSRSVRKTAQSHVRLIPESKTQSAQFRFQPFFPIFSWRD